MKGLVFTTLCCVAALCGCSSGRASTEVDTLSVDGEARLVQKVDFDADSAYQYVARQVEFGPRVGNTPQHRQCGDWLEKMLRDSGAAVTVQNVSIDAADGVTLQARNILGRFNPSASDRTLLVAHWDTRPWADEDPDSQNHNKPVPGANDGASGVGVLLEIARHASSFSEGKGVDILFVDAEDRGLHDDDESWALGAKEFAANPPISGYRPARVVLLDMVGGTDAKFHKEQFSQYYAPDLVSELWSVASASGYADRFVDAPGGAITDDHLEFIKTGIPAIDIIEYNSDTGFPAVWHTVSDDMNHISRETLKAVGQTVLNWLCK